jgi:hypothetical protein
MMAAAIFSASVSLGASASVRQRQYGGPSRLAAAAKPSARARAGSAVGELTRRKGVLLNSGISFAM